VFTTNNLDRLTDRFIRRCEVHRFDAISVPMIREEPSNGKRGKRKTI